MNRSSIFAFISLAFICANFISCDNFLNSADVKKEIEDVIAFNNAKVVNVSLECDKNVGTLFPNQTYQARVGYPFEVQFIPDTDNYKIKDDSKIFKAESLRDKENPDRSSYVDIQVIEQSFEDKKSGVYRANITVTQYADDIRICPECVAVPKINKITPENKKNGEDQDTPIIITFNKPMDAASFGDYSCISISSSEGNAWDYYDAPEFSDDKTQLTIQPKTGVLLLPPDEAKVSDEITLSIDCTDIKDVDGLYLAQSYSYNFKINQNYGNKKVVQLTVKVDDSSMGSITPAGQVSCNVGYTTTLKFEMNKNDFILSDSETALKAVSANGGSVSFTTLSTTQTENIIVYTIKARVLKEADDIVITPNCIKVPKLLSITPQQFSTGCDQDTPIIIKFNKAVNPESFGDFSCISISNENQDLKQYFGTPYFSENNTTLTIPTAQNTLILPPDGSKLQMEITVNIDAANLKDSDGLSIPQTDKYKYTINKNFGNQKKITVLIRTVEGTGSFLVDGEKEGVVGYSLGELQFTANKKLIVFQGLEAVSKTNTSISRNDSVEFTTISSNDETGVYSIRVRILEEVNDILIRPKYILRPAIVDYSPKNTDYLSVPIFITFNEPVEDVSIPAKDSVFNSSNVSIKCDNQTINNCFNAPSLNNTKDILSLTPKSEILTAFFRSRGLSTTDITVSFDSRTQFNLGGTQVQFAEDKSLSITIHYSVDFETDSPEKIKFGASRNWDAEESSSQDDFYQSSEYFVYDNSRDDMNQRLYYLNDYSDSEILKNRTKGIVYIYGEYSDEGSNVQLISVDEEYLDSDQSYDPTRHIDVDYTANSAGIIKWETDSQTGITSFCIKHEIQHEDGTIQISVTVLDGCGNPSETEYFTIFNVNTVDFGGAIPVNAYYSEDYYEEKDFDMDYFNENVKNIKLIYDIQCNYDLIFEDYIFCAYYGHKIFDPDGIFTKIECEYIDDDGVLTSLPMTKYVYDQNTYPDVKNWNCTLTNVQSVNGLKIKINVEDDLGNTGSMDYVFPLERTIESVQTNGNTKTITLSEMPDTPSYGLIIYKGINDGDDDWKAYYDIITQFNIEEGYEYYYIANDSGYLTSELSSLYTYNSNFSMCDYEIGFVEEPEIQTAENEKTNIIVKIPQEAWDYYDKIFVKQNYSTYTRYYYFESDATQLTITTNTKTLFKYDNSITVFGEKNKICKQGETKAITVTKINDNIAPSFSNDSWHWPQNLDIDHLYIKIKEEETDIKSITFNGKSYPYTQDGANYKVVLNLYDCIDYSTPQQPIWNINLVATDKADNSGILDRTDEYVIKNEVPIIKQKNASGITFKRVSDGGIIFEYFNETSKKWMLTGYTMGSGELECKIKNKFLKVRALYSSPKYYYTGLDSSYEFKNSGKYDYILANGSSKESVVVSSDAPVFVHTVVTTYPYDTCKYWTVDDWEFYKKTIGDEQFDFTARDQQKYNIPVEQINQYECYVVIAHFADGTSAMSDVMVKY